MRAGSRFFFFMNISLHQLSDIRRFRFVRCALHGRVAWNSLEMIHFSTYESWFPLKILFFISILITIDRLQYKAFIFLINIEFPIQFTRCISNVCNIHSAFL